jgi:hypothetical protein
MVFGQFCGLVPMCVLGLAGPVGTEGSVVPVICHGTDVVIQSADGFDRAQRLGAYRGC